MNQEINRERNSEQNLTSGPEKIVSCALRFQGQLFKGATHAHALDQLEVHSPNWNKSGDYVEDGFMTSAGRFVKRKEAEEIAKRTSTD